MNGRPFENQIKEVFEKCRSRDSDILQRKMNHIRQLLDKDIEPGHFKPARKETHSEYYRIAYMIKGQCTFNHTSFSSQLTCLKLVHDDMVSVMGKDLVIIKIEKSHFENFTASLSNGKLINIEICAMCKQWVNTQDQLHYCSGVGSSNELLAYILMINHIGSIVSNTSKRIMYSKKENNNNRALVN